MNHYIQTVGLTNVKCFSKHGWYTEEQLTGSWFTVNLTVSFYPSTNQQNLDDTVNYEFLNEIIIENMQKTEKLLETVVRRILDAVLLLNSNIVTVFVKIEKNNPPMSGEIENSFVSLNYDKNGIH